MYDIEYYFDKNGYSAISDYFADLAKKSIYSKTGFTTWRRQLPASRLLPHT